MNKLELQQTCFNNIKYLCTNYSKDPASRKNEEYLNKRLESLENQWSDFDERHAQLTTEMDNKNINYFTDDIYNKTKDMYIKTKTDIVKRLEQINEQKQKEVKFDLGEMPKEENSSDCQHLLNKQECNFNAIDRVMSKINIQLISEKWELEDNLALLKSKWEPIDKLHWEIDFQLKGCNEKYYDLFSNIEQKYDELRKKINSKIYSSVHYHHSAPRLELPEFSGSYQQWISFKNLFLETINNNPTINPAQKMQYLKTKLRGEPERLVQHLNISAENYTSCWEILSQRYDNRRLQFTSFMNTMLNLPSIQHPDAYNLKRLHDVITESLNGISNIGIDTATWDPIIVHLMSQKLDSTTFNEYMKDLQDHRELQNLNDFMYFLESKFMAYETMKTPKREPIISQKPFYSKSLNKNTFSKKNNYEFQKPVTKSYHTSYGQCPCCDGNHVLMQCTKFIDMDTTQRNDTVTKLRLCKNCFFSHGNNDCKSTKTCKECNLKHHTLLHNSNKKQIIFSGKNNNMNRQQPSSSQSSPASHHPSSNHLSNENTEILLTTVQLKAKTLDGSYITLRALLDQGSQVNLITENAAQRLRLPRKKLNAMISGIGSVSGDCKGRLHLSCKAIHSDYSFDIQALIMKKLTNNLPNSTFKNTNWPHLQNLKLADPEYNISRGVDLLLGADIYSEIILDGVLKGSNESPVAQQTQLGWILCGKMKTLNCYVSLVNMEDLTKFWEYEDIKNSNKITRDENCEKFYKETVRRAPDGKYIVKMPIASDYKEKIGNSRSIAASQFYQLEKRLQKQHKLASMYKDFVREYQDLGHMIPSPQFSKTSHDCYLPHHGFCGKVLKQQNLEWCSMRRKETLQDTA